MNFSEAANGVVLWTKLFLKISQYSRKSYKPATLKQNPTQVFSSEYSKIFKNIYFEEHLLGDRCFCNVSFIKFK